MSEPIRLPAGTVEPTRATEHVKHLLAYTTMAAIADAAGVDNVTIARIARGQVLYVRRDTERYLLSLTPALVTRIAVPGARVDKTPSVNRLHALMRIGWPQAVLSRMMGRAVGATPAALTARGQYITAHHARQVQALYDRISGTPGPSAQSAATAARRGWLPPLAYDDDMRPLPGALRTPYRAKMDGLAERREARARRAREIAERTEAEQISAEMLAQEYGVTARTVVRARSERRGQMSA